MATYVTPKINTIYIFYISVVSQANTKIFQANPTIAAGDFLVATDDGAPANLGTLPVVDADFTKRLKVTLSAAEMNGGNVTFIASDAAGAEWCDLTINIQTTARQVDDLAFPATSGRSMVVDAAGLVDANTVKLGATGAGTAQTARDLGLAIPAAVAGAAGGLFIAGTNAATTITTALTTTFTGNLTGSVASVSGAVGSVTGAVGSVTGAVGSVTAAVTVGTINANVITAAATAADFGAELATAIWTDITAGDFTVALSVGKSVMNGVALGTGLTINAYTGNTVQTGDSFARIGAAGVSLTAVALADATSDAVLADAIWNAATVTYGAAGSYGLLVETDLDATISSRMATYVQPTGFLAATFPPDPADQSLIIAATDAIIADTNDIQARLPAALTIDGNIKADTLRIGGTLQTAGDLAALVTTVDTVVDGIAADLPQRITKNVALAAFPFKMVQSSDHVTPATGLAVTAQRSIDGAAFGACANAVTETGSGWYKINLAATDLNGDTIGLKFTAAATDQVDLTIVTEPT